METQQRLNENTEVLQLLCSLGKIQKSLLPAEGSIPITTGLAGL